MDDDDSWVEAEGQPLANPDPFDAAKAKTDLVDIPAGAPSDEPVVTQGSGRPDAMVDGTHGYSEAHPDSHQAD